MTTKTFFEHPILNSPYVAPTEHWELDETGQPTNRLIAARRKAEFITPIPKAKKRRNEQTALVMNEGQGLSDARQQYELTSSFVNALRTEIEQWRALPEPSWSVTPETARLLKHWRQYEFQGVRPFFCQVEAVETVIWLTEVAPNMGAKGKRFLDHLTNASRDANPELLRLALKLATGAGKTTVMAMLIAWQTINAVRRPGSKNFTRGFLIVAPGITIKDRLRVLLPNDADSYYQSRELVPADLLPEVQKAKIVITNFHAFKLRERLELSKGTRSMLQGRGDALQTLETEGQMIQRVMPDLMGLKNILAINDEAHHCYREKPDDIDEEEELTGDQKKEADENREAARMWISGLEAVKRNLGLLRVIDLSATPFFLSGSGYAEGTLFPWTMCDFSLMDAIECGIVKLPRVPVADNIPGAEVPMFRDLWSHIGKKMPKKGKGKELDPLSLPTELQTALEALYGHYAKTYELWKRERIFVPPCFIVVCNNTATSKLVYDYISGFFREDGKGPFVPGQLELFRNYNTDGDPFPRPRTLLIDSMQLESGEKLDDNFHKVAGPELAIFKQEVLERGGKLAEEIRGGKEFSDATILREVMNTVGKRGRLGESIRCVVSVSMLTEGWDANTVTHVLGLRAFGTQLLCEQVIGRALRRQSYDLNEHGLFNIEYADILGIPFDFTAKPVVAPPQAPRETVQVKAIKPDRDPLEIRFPRVQGYRVELPEERIEAKFTDEHILTISPDDIGPSITQTSGIIGEPENLTLAHTRDTRQSTVVMHLTKYLLFHHWRDEGGEPKMHLFGQLKRAVNQWIERHLVCKGDTYPAQLLYLELTKRACDKIAGAITLAGMERNKDAVRVILDPYNPSGSSRHVNFNTSKRTRWETDARKSHINWVVCDSDWEAEFCRVAESHDKVLAYVKNQGLGLEVPYQMGSGSHVYLPDFIVLVDDGKGWDDPLHLIVEIKGYRGEDAIEKKRTMDTYWIPGVNQLGTFGRWGFVEFTDNYLMDEEFKAKIAAQFDALMGKVCG